MAAAAGSISKNKSSALAFEIRLKELFEKHPTSPNINRIDECFRIYDEISTYYPSFQGVFGLIRDEFYRSIFSNMFTSEDNHIKRLPHFVLAARTSLYETQITKTLKEEIEELNKKLKYREKDIVLLNKRNMSLKQEIMVTESQHKKNAEKLSAYEREIRDFSLVKDQILKEKEYKEYEFQSEISKLKQSLEEASTAIEKLTIFKPENMSGDVTKGLEQVKEYARFQVENRQLKFSPEELTDYDMKEAYKIYFQIGELLNVEIEDYERAVSVVEKKKAIINDMTMQVVDNNMEKENFENELDDITKKFRKISEEIRQEQDKLKSHQVGLVKLKEQYIKDKEFSTVARMGDEALKKYAVKMYLSSDNGQTYLSIRTDICMKCHDKVIACPHVSYHDRCIKLPEKTTHIKIIQPTLRIRDLRAMKDLKMISDKLDVPENIESSTIRKLLKDFVARGGTRPLNSRSFSKNSLLQKLNELLDARWRLDYEIVKEDRDEVLPQFLASEEERIQHIDFFYEFLKKRYVFKDIAMSFAYDFMLSLLKEESTDLNVWIFCKALSGEDDISWKYTRVILDYLNNLDFDDNKVIKEILVTIYPNRTKEEYEHLELDVLAFGKSRKINSEIIVSYIRYNIARKTESNYKFFFYRLKKYDFANQGCFTAKLFEDYLNQILPFASTRSKRRLYKSAQVEMQEDRVSIERLAAICAYLFLTKLQENNWVKDTETAKVFGVSNDAESDEESDDDDDNND